MIVGWFAIHRNFKAIERDINCHTENKIRFKKVQSCVAIAIRMAKKTFYFGFICCPAITLSIGSNNQPGTNVFVDVALTWMWLLLGCGFDLDVALTLTLTGKKNFKK